jgi:crossover junction endodeoxyribonuclease RuvC
MKIVGLDLSLSATGIADDAGPRRLKTPASKMDGMKRLQFIRNQVMLACAGAGCVFLEGYSFGSRNGGERLGELGGVIRLALYEAETPYVEVAPNTLKMLATGKGNANKAEVLVSAVTRLGYAGTDDNEADALWLWIIGRLTYGLPVLKLPQTHLRALEKVKRP